MMSDFLGRGWAFPVKVNARGGLDWSAGAKSIEEGIWIILATPRRSRIMEPEFGCGLHDYVFAPNNANTRAVIASEVRSALIRYEPRIDVLAVKTEPQIDAQNTLLIEVDYRIRANNAVRNLVYPFFLNESPA
jgi:phage baseplate assembly protein W